MWQCGDMQRCYRHQLQYLVFQDPEWDLYAQAPKDYQPFRELVADELCYLYQEGVEFTETKWIDGNEMTRHNQVCFHSAHVQIPYVKASAKAWSLKANSQALSEKFWLNFRSGLQGVLACAVAQQHVFDENPVNLKLSTRGRRRRKWLTVFRCPCAGWRWNWYWKLETTVGGRKKVCIKVHRSIWAHATSVISRALPAAASLSIQVSIFA